MYIVPPNLCQTINLKNMNYRNLLIYLSIFFVAGSIIYISSFPNETAQYTPRSIEKQFKSQGYNAAADWIYNIKMNQITGLIDHNDVLKARQEVLSLTQNKTLNINWAEVGPDNIGGRVRAILVDKNNPNIVYAAGVAGGIFKSVTGGSSWVKVNDLSENLAVVSMAQCPLTGHIYAGTGEGLGNGPMATTSGGTAFLGKGIYKSTDGNTFSLIASTIPNVSNSTSADWATVNELAVDENGWIYAATNKGLRLSKNGGDSWTNPVIYPASTPYTAFASDVNVAKVGSTKVVVASVGNKCFISTTGDSDYINHSTGSANKLPSTSVARVELAIAPSNPNYIYAALSRQTGNLLNVYRTTDMGANWEIIGLGGTTVFEPFRGQGTYNNTIAVFPNNPDKIILGGIDIWSWEAGGNWEQKTLWYLEETNPYYVHADVHEFVFHPTQPNTFYVGSDGGVSKSTDGGISYSTINKNFNTVQYYAISCSRDGAVMGGTQDNGTILIDRTGNTVQNGVGVMGGDGGGSAISIINPDAYFATTYYAGVRRSPNKGVSFYPSESVINVDNANPFFSNRMLALGNPGDNFPAGFVTPLLIWETFNDIYSPDSVMFTALDTSYAAGSVVMVKSKTGYLFEYQLPYTLNDGDYIMVHDKIQSRFYLGIDNAIWMTRQALDFSIQPEWYKIATISGQTITMSVSKDGNYLFVATLNGNVYRISNLRYANDSLSADVLSPYMLVETKLLAGGLPSGRVPTSIAIDPSNANHVIVTYGNYGNTNYIYRSTNALSESPTFSPKQGNLPKMPVYASIIEMSNSNLVIIGTEYGVYATENISAPSVVWTDVNDNGMANVPVYMLVQQIYNYPGVSNYGVIYAGTHGRGIFETGTYMGINDNEKPKLNTGITLNIYPNPLSETANIYFNVKGTSTSILKVYDIQGRLKDTFEISNTGTFSFDCSTYTRGTYIVQLVSGNSKASAKFIKY